MEIAAYFTRNVKQPNNKKIVFRAGGQEGKRERNREVESP